MKAKSTYQSSQLSRYLLLASPAPTTLSLDVSEMMASEMGIGNKKLDWKRQKKTTIASLPTSRSLEKRNLNFKLDV